MCELKNDSCDCMTHPLAVGRADGPQPGPEPLLLPGPELPQPSPPGVPPRTRPPPAWLPPAAWRPPAAPADIGPQPPIAAAAAPAPPQPTKKPNKSNITKRSNYIRYCKASFNSTKNWYGFKYDTTFDSTRILWVSWFGKKPTLDHSWCPLSTVVGAKNDWKVDSG